MDHSGQRRAKQYAAIQNWLFVGQTAVTLAALLVFLLTGWSRDLADTVRTVAGNPWLQGALFAAVFVVATRLVLLPFNWFAGYWLEHWDGLSTERLGRWAGDELKSLGLQLVLGVLAVDVVYFLLRRAGDWWWLGAGAVFLGFTVMFSLLYPVVILPLFYQLVPLDNEALRARLVALAQRIGARVVGVYRLGLSAKTKKANAALAGLGRTKRILLGDTLLTEFTEDEIEAVLAHELAHDRHDDLPKMILWSAVTTVTGFWICEVGLTLGGARLGVTDRADLGAFPLLALCFLLVGLLVMPVNNAFARWRERKADRAAVEWTGNVGGFVRAMRKLTAQNLADETPHPVIEFLLHDHPSLGKRIRWAEQWPDA